MKRLKWIPERYAGEILKSLRRHKKASVSLILTEYLEQNHKKKARGSGIILTRGQIISILKYLKKINKVRNEFPSKRNAIWILQ